MINSEGRLCMIWTNNFIDHWYKSLISPAAEILIGSLQSACWSLSVTYYYNFMQPTVLDQNRDRKTN